MTGLGRNSGIGRGKGLGLGGGHGRNKDGGYGVRDTACVLNEEFCCHCKWINY